MTQSEYGQAYRQGFGKTVRLLCSRGASLDWAEDIAQDAWLQGWRRLHQLRDAELILSWINTIALNYQRRNGRLEGRYQALSGLELSNALDCHNRTLDFERLLHSCPLQERMLLEQHLVGLSTREIADQHGTSTGAIRLRLFRARRTIRAQLTDPQRRQSPIEDPLRLTLGESKAVRRHLVN